jgi:alpha-glucosidase (family GH31 glycosyl hydrolase)
VRYHRSALIALLTLPFAPPAAASVSIGPARVVVRAGSLSAVVERSPFRLRIGPLSEVASRRTARPTVLAPVADPVAPGTEPSRSGQLYAPLSFLVGSESLSQYQGGVWGGNLMSGAHSGVQYSARAVVGARAVGPSEVSLTVSTDDPSGRRLRVDIRASARRLISVTVTPRPARGVAMMSDSFASDGPREAFHGFGGAHNSLDQHGQALASFVQEENVPGLGKPGTPAAVLYPNGPTAAYYPQALFYSSHGYGFTLDQPELARFRLDSDRPDAWSVAVSAPVLRYLVAPRSGIPAVTAVSGRQPAPPAWALGPMFDRLVKNVGETEADYESQLRQDIANIDRYRLPLTAYRIEGWGMPGVGNDGLALHTFVSFGVQSRVISELRARGIHPLAYLRPWITPGSAPDRAGLTVHDSAGRTFLTTGTAGQHIALLDFTNPRAVAFWRREVRRVLDFGFDGFMQDFGEEVLGGMRFADGETGLAMHNRYLVLFMRATRSELDAYQRAHRRRTLWFFNRAGYSGTPGSAAYEGGNFPGDESTDWGQAAGLASLAPDMLNRAVGGAFGYGTDIGGYYDYTTPPTTKQLFLRWAEWAALSPIFRLHGSGRSGTHAPWTYDRQTIRAYRALSLLHERAAPLILRLWRAAVRTGIPPTRPLWLEFPADRRAATQAQEWTLGDDVLVAPVVVEGALGRRVYFPAGCWRDPQTGLVVRGPRSAFAGASLTQLPYFFRCGTHPFP